MYLLKTGAHTNEDRLCRQQKIPNAHRLFLPQEFFCAGHKPQNTECATTQPTLKLLVVFLVATCYSL